MSYRPTHVKIDIDALRSNVRQLKTWAGDVFFCPMLKANAYGHGDVTVARALEGLAEHFGVVMIEEAIRLRRAGIRTPILVFSSLNKASAEALVEYKLTPVLGRLEDFAALQEAKVPHHHGVHLEFNTGMQRHGFDRVDVERLHELKRQWRITGLCTHLTHGHDFGESEGHSARQIALFEQLTEGLPGLKHVHKTASLTRKSSADRYGARPGIGVYGLAHEGKTKGENLRPVLSWHTELTQVHKILAGESVGYSSRWTARRPTSVGVVPVGYGDGFLRAYGRGASMLFRGQKVPVIGSVCMDYVMLDLTDALSEGQAKPGEPVVILGQQGAVHVQAEDLAEVAGTITYEVVTAIRAR